MTRSSPTDPSSNSSSNSEQSTDRTQRPTDPPDGLHRLRGRLVAGVRSRIARPIRRRAPLAPLVAAHELRRRVAPGRYTDASAFALREVDPSRIRESVLESAPRRPQWGRVVDGNWDERTESFDERAVPRGIQQRYREGRDWRDTALFDAFRDQLDRFGNAWGHVDVDGFDRRCEAIDRLHDAIRDRGYRRQETLHGPDAYATTARLDEICVDLARDGRLLWRAYGQHRLALAKLLGVDSVPVLVHRRHASWQATRESVRAGRPTPEADRDHPDLRDLARDDELTPREARSWTTDGGGRR